MIPTPVGISLQDWADDVVLELQGGGPVPVLYGDNWTEWAERLLELNPPIQQVVPSPAGFTDWREWASRFVLAVT